MADQPKRGRGMLRAAGRATFSLLRETQKRAKLGSMHLPITLHPNHKQAIVLPLGAPEEVVAAQAEPVELRLRRSPRRPVPSAVAWALPSAASRGYATPWSVSGRRRLSSRKRSNAHRF